MASLNASVVLSYVGGAGTDPATALRLHARRQLRLCLQPDSSLCSGQVTYRKPCISGDKSPVVS